MKKVVWKNTCIEEKFVAGPEDFSLQCTNVNNTYSSTPYWTLVPTYLDAHWTQEKALGLVACSVVPKTMG
jgi:hypothetical protein